MGRPSDSRDDPRRLLRRHDDGHGFGGCRPRGSHPDREHHVLPEHAGQARRRGAAVAVREVTPQPVRGRALEALRAAILHPRGLRLSAHPASMQP